MPGTSVISNFGRCILAVKLPFEKAPGRLQHAGRKFLKFLINEKIEIEQKNSHLIAQLDKSYKAKCILIILRIFQFLPGVPTLIGILDTLR